MRFRLTIFLLIANLVVFALIALDTRERERGRPAPEQIFPDDADSIAVDTGSPETSYKIVRKTGRWNLEAPYEWPANPWIVEKMFGELRFLSHANVFSLSKARALGGDDDVYGLDKPAGTVTVTAGSRVTTVKLGRLTADGSACYLLAPDGDNIIPAPLSFVSAVLRKPEDIRRNEIFSIDAFEARAIEIVKNEPDEKGASKETRIGLVCEKRRETGGESDFFWRFETPVACDADTNGVKTALNTLLETAFVRFIPASGAALEKTGLTAPGLRLTLNGNNRRQTLLVGEPAPGTGAPARYAKFDDIPAVFTIPDATLDTWRNARVKLREPHFLRFDAATLTGITITEGDISLVLHRIDAPGAGRASEWQMPVVVGGKVAAVTPADPDELGRLVNSLAKLAARDFQPPVDLPPESLPLYKAFVKDDPTPADLKAWGFEKSKWRVDLDFADGEKKTRRTLRIADRLTPSAPLHAKLDDAPTVHTVAPAITKDLGVEPGKYRRRLLLGTLVGDKITALKLTDIATGNTLVNEADPAAAAGDATKPKESRDKLSALVAALREVRAEAFLDKPFSPDFRHDAGDGLPVESWRYRLEWSVAPAAGTPPVRHELSLTRRLGGATQVGGLAEPAPGIVFTIKQGLIDALNPLTFGKDDSKDIPPVRAPGPAEPPPAAPDGAAKP